MILALIGGTWARHKATNWDYPGSSFAAAAVAQGFTLSSPRFSWSTEIDGVIGPDAQWEDAAEKLCLHARVYGVDAIVAHSHAGNVVALACAQGLRLTRLVTVAMPVRREDEMTAAYAATRIRVERWTHVHSDATDGWQWWGSLALADLWHPWRLFTVPRETPLAHVNLAAPGHSHGALLDPAWWTTAKLWDALR